MSVEDNSPRWIPSLQHIAKVKTIETLWRNSEGKEVINNVFNESFHNGDYSDGRYNKLSETITQRLTLSLNDLLLPPVITKDLKTYVIFMVFKALCWLRKITADARNRALTGSGLSERTEKPAALSIICRIKDFFYKKNLNRDLEMLQDYWTERISHFVDNFSWDNFGCVDGIKILKSYICNKTTIDFVIWHQLCVYCMEDDIIRFADTIDWNKCRQFNNSHYSIYWYWKIYGKFPTGTMFAKLYSKFKEDSDAGLYDEHNIIENMFKRSAVYNRSHRPNISAMMFFRNLLKKDCEEFHGFVADVIMPFNSPEEGAIHLLRETHRSPSCRGLSNRELLKGLVQWPSILFIDNMTSVLETLPGWVLLVFIDEVLSMICCDNTESRQVTFQEAHGTTFYEQIETLLTIFYRRFMSDAAMIHAAVWISLKRLNINCCKIMFDGLKIDQKSLFFQSLGDILRKFRSFRFCEERVIFLRETEEVIAKLGFVRNKSLDSKWG